MQASARHKGERATLRLFFHGSSSPGRRIRRRRCHATGNLRLRRCGPAAARPPAGEASARTPGASRPHPSGAQQNRVPCFYSGACVSGAVRPGRPRLAQTPRRTRRRCQKSQQEGDRAAVRDRHRKMKRDATACKISRSRRYVYYRNTNWKAQFKTLRIRFEGGKLHLKKWDRRKLPAVTRMF